MERLGTPDRLHNHSQRRRGTRQHRAAEFFGVRLPINWVKPQHTVERPEMGAFTRLIRYRHASDIVQRGLLKHVLLQLKERCARGESVAIEDRATVHSWIGWRAVLP